MIITILSSYSENQSRAPAHPRSRLGLARPHLQRAAEHCPANCVRVNQWAANHAHRATLTMLSRRTTCLCRWARRRRPAPAVSDGRFASERSKSYQEENSKRFSCYSFSGESRYPDPRHLWWQSFCNCRSLPPCLRGMLSYRTVGSGSH